MALTAADILFLASDPAAGSGYTSIVQTTPEGSLGGFCSRNTIASGQVDCLFNDLTGVQNAAGQTDYQCLFICNGTASGLTAMNPVVWMPASNYTAGASIQFALDPAAPSLKTSSTAQALTISSPLTAPAITGGWASPSATLTGGITCPALLPGYVQAVWIKRAAANSSASADDQFGLQLTFNTNG